MVERVAGIEFDVVVDGSSAVNTSKAVVVANEKLDQSFRKVDDSTKRLPSSLSRLGNAYSSTNAKLSEFVAQQIEAGRKIDAAGNVVTAYGVKAKGLTSELQKLTAQNASAKEKVDALSSAMRMLSGEAEKVTQEVKQQDTAVDGLNTELSTAQGAYSTLSAGVNELTAAHEKSTGALANAIARQISLGNTIDKNNRVIDANGNEVQQATAALRRYAEQNAQTAKQVRATDDALGRMSGGARGALGAVGGLRGAAGQLGFQVQDMAVQLQAGTNALTVFGQQGSQIAGIFGPTGAVVGAVLAVAAAIGTALIPSLTKAEGELSELPEDVIKRLDTLKKKLQETDQASLGSVAQVEVAKLNKEYDQLIKSADSFEKLALETATALNGSAEEAARLSRQAEDAREKAANIAITIGEVTKETLKAKQGWQGVTDNAEEANQKINTSAELTRNLAQSVALSEAKLAGNTAEAERLQAAFQFGVSTFEQMPESAQALVNRLIAVREQQKLASEEKIKQMKLEQEAEQASGQRKSGIEQLKQEFMSEQQLKAEKFLRDGELLRESLAAQEITKAEFDVLEKERVAQHQQWLIEQTQQTADERARIEKRHQDVVASFRNSAIQNAANLLDQFAGESKAAAIAAIAINKGLALAQNTQNTLVAQTRALAELGPIAGPPVAATIGTYGAINAGLIAATGLAQAATLGNRGGSANISSSAQSSTQAAQANVQQEPQRQIVDVRVTGKGGGIVDMFNFEVQNGAQPIMTGG